MTSQSTDARLPTAKGHYRSGQDDLGVDFFAPCFAASKAYRRASGYFSSGALLTWAEGLLRLGAGKQVSIKLIASPELSADDRATLERLNDPKERERHQEVLVEHILDEIVELARGRDDRAVRASVFAWLIANGKLDIRFAFPINVDEQAYTTRRCASSISTTAHRSRSRYR
uniref:hypothetical protein n=1 Tax=Pantanalinema rosaneae TaxID=1620701 RepID=UPI003D6E3D3F